MQRTVTQASDGCGCRLMRVCTWLVSKIVACPIGCRSRLILAVRSMNAHCKMQTYALPIRSRLRVGSRVARERPRNRPPFLPGTPHCRLPVNACSAPTPALHSRRVRLPAPRIENRPCIRVHAGAYSTLCGIPPTVTVLHSRAPANPGHPRSLLVVFPGRALHSFL